MKSLPKLTSIEVEGYKSLRERTRVQIRPLTILAGTNSSGKSSLLQPLLLMKQTFECSHDPGPLLLDGPNLQARSFSELTSRGREPEFRLQLEGVTEDGVTRSSWKFQRTEGQLQIAEQISRTDSELEKREFILRPGLAVDAQASPLLVSTLFPSQRLVCIRRKCLLGYRPEDDSLLPSDLIYSPAAWANGVAGGLIHLPGLRGNPQRDYPRTAVSDRFPGQFQDYVASLIAEREQHPERMKALDAALSILGLTSSVSSRPIGDTSYELRVRRAAKGEDFVNIADVGLGVSQALPVLVALAVALPHQVVYIEQPEIHLHPRAQSRLATLLVEAANRGVTVIAETHSSLLLRGVQTALAQGKVTPDAVALHWFSRDAKGWSSVHQAELDEQGRFGDWSVDFDDVELQAQDAYLTASFS